MTPSYQCCGSGSVWIRFIWPDPFQTIRIRIWVAPKTFNKCKDENAKFLLNVQGFEYLWRFLIDKGNPQNFSFQKKAKKFRNFEI